MREVIEAIGVSRRIDSQKDEMVTFAVELVGLTTQEVSELARETTAAATAGGKERNAPAPPATGEEA